MIKCEVNEDRFGNLQVIFDDNTSIYLQTDYDRSAFGVNCGAIKAPEDWDGCPSNLPDDWWEIDFEDITECPKEYKDGAE